MGVGVTALGVPIMGNAAASLRGRSGAVGVATPDGPWKASVPLACVRQCGPVRESTRTNMVHLRFGVPAGGQSVSIAGNASIRLGPGRIVLLTGPSGSGKSSALSAIESQFGKPSPLPGGITGGWDKRRIEPLGISRGDQGECINVRRIEFSDDCGIIDEVAPHGGFAEAASILTACGLGEASLWLRPISALSDGEKFRACLARAISLQADRRVHLDAPSLALLLCDEFCSGLHRRAAKAIAYNLRKLVTRRGLCIVVASSTEDLTADLDPDTLVQFLPSRYCDVTERTPRKNAVPDFRRRLRIEQGGKRDYEIFAGMHYRNTDELGFVDRVFVLRDGAGGDPLGIVVYSHPALELSLRNKATNGWFSRKPERVNQHLRILRRLVIHPDVRGCGLGHYLVRKTMPLLGTEYVECLAAMGEFNPVFERAGMTRVGQYDAPPGPRAALESLRAMDVDPQSTGFAVLVARRPDVRTVVAQAVADWYAATTAGGKKRVERQSPEVLARTFRGLIGLRPVYYLWCRRRTHHAKDNTFANEPACQPQ